MGKINLFLSDIHIGNNSPTTWYQKDVHQSYLKTILKYVQDNGERIHDFIILGDWFDLWTYPPDLKPPNVKEILAAPTNKKIFTPQSDGSGDFVSCLDNIQGQLRFVNGNHDMTVSCQDLNDHFQPLSQKGRQVICEGSLSKNLIYESGDIHAQHGHEFSLFNRLDNNDRNRYKPLPLGYYISRTVSLICTQKLNEQNKASAALLPDSGNPTFSFEYIHYDTEYIEKLLSKDLTLAQAILFDLVSRAGVEPENLMYTMPDGTTISARDAADMFPELSVEDWDSLAVDIKNSLTNQSEQLGWGEGTIAHKVVIMGHTHVPKMIEHPHGFGVPQWVYVNSGFNCADKPGMEAGNLYPTFVEVEKTNDGYEARFKKIDYPNKTISTIKSMNIS